MPHSNIADPVRKFARRLRKEPTIAEKRLWPHLKAMRVQGVHFRRQTPIGIYVADFAWLQGRFIVELDGGQHADVRVGHDAKRDAWLRGQVFTVLRFWNALVFEEMESVVETIWRAADERRKMLDKREAAPLGGLLEEHKTPPPRGEG